MNNLSSNKVSPLKIEFESSPLSLLHWLVLLLSFLVIAGLWTLNILADEDVSFPENISPHEALLGPDDDIANINLDMKSPDFTEKKFIIFGTSIAREAVWDREKLKSELKKITGNESAFLINGAGNLSMLEILFFVHDAPLRQNQVLLLFTTPAGFGEMNVGLMRLKNGFHLQSPVSFANIYKNEIPQLAPLANNFQKHLINSKVSISLVYRKVQGRIRGFFATHFYNYDLENYFQKDRLLDREIFNEQRKIQFMDGIQNVVKGSFKNYPQNERILSLIVEKARSKGAQVVLLDSPAIWQGKLYGIWWDRYLETMQRVSQNLEVPFIQINKRVEFENSDFSEGMHVTRAGKEKWSQAFISWLGEWLQAEKINENGIETSSIEL